MPRAKASSRLEVQQRSGGDEQFASPLADRWWTPTLLEISFSDLPAGIRKAEEDRVLVKKLAAQAGISDPAERAQVKRKLHGAIAAYRARVLGDKQESPARILAALKPGVKLARQLLAWMDTLSAGMLIELQAGGIKEFCERVINCEAYWQQHAGAGPVGAAGASLALRRALSDIITSHRPDIPEVNRRKWVADACIKIDADFPNEKKNRRRFVGEQKRPSKPGPRLHLRPLRKSASERRLARKLKGIPI